VNIDRRRGDIGQLLVTLMACFSRLSHLYCVGALSVSFPAATASFRQPASAAD